MNSASNPIETAASLAETSIPMPYGPFSPETMGVALLCLAIGALLATGWLLHRGERKASALASMGVLCGGLGFFVGGAVVPGMVLVERTGAILSWSAQARDACAAANGEISIGSVPRIEDSTLSRLMEVCGSRAVVAAGASPQSAISILPVYYRESGEVRMRYVSQPRDRQST